MITSVDHEAAEFLRRWCAETDSDAVTSLEENDTNEAEAEEQLSLALAQVEETVQRFELESEAIEITEVVEEFDSPAPTAFVIYNTDTHRFLYGTTPTGRVVLGANIQNAQIFDRQGVEVGKLHGISLPAPWFVLGGAR